METPVLELALLTDVGQAREHNEDSVLAMRLGAEAGRSFNASALLLVADGVGGHEAGEVASGEAVNVVRARFEDSNWLADRDAESALQDIIQEANARIYAFGGTSLQSRPGTTLTVALTGRQSYCIDHVGDSRAYLVDRHSATQLTNDDTHVAEAVRRNQMTPEEAKVHPYRNQITQCVGTSEVVRPAVIRGEWKTGDVLLLCSDGLSEYVDDDELAATLRTSSGLADACDRLVALANDRGGHDNISVVLARNGGGIAGRKPATPAFETPPPDFAKAPHHHPHRRSWPLVVLLALAGVGLVGAHFFRARRRIPAILASPVVEAPLASSAPKPLAATRLMMRIDDEARVIRGEAVGFALSSHDVGLDAMRSEKGSMTVRFRSWERTRPTLDSGAWVEVRRAGKSLARIAAGMKPTSVPIHLGDRLDVVYVGPPPEKVEHRLASFDALSLETSND